MPIFTATSALDTDFTGLAAATGLFDPAAHTGARNIQVRINSVNFSGPTAITDWTLNRIDPGTPTQTIDILTGTATSFATGGPAGFDLLPTNSDGAPWQYSIVTNGLTGVGVIKIDWDFVSTEG